MKYIKLAILSLPSLLLLGCFPLTSHAKINKKLNIALILWRGETPAEQGFKHELTNLGYKVNYTIYDARQDKTRLNNLLRKEIRADSFDYIYTFGTTVSVKTKNLLGEKTNQIFNVVSYPVKSGLVESLNKAGRTINGVKSDVSLRKQIEHAREVLPFDTLGILFNPRENNSNITLDELTQLSREFNFKLIKFRAPPVHQRLELCLERVIADDSGVSVVFIPADSYISSKAKHIANTLNQHGIKTIGANKKLITEGILFGTVADYFTLGKQAAEIIHANQKGLSLNAIPVEKPRPQLIVNSSTMLLLDLDIQSQSITTHFLP